MNSGSKPISKIAIRHYVIVMAFAIVGGALVLRVPSFFNTTSVAELYATSSTEISKGMSRLAPVRIQIPSIKLDTTFVSPLTLNADKTISVPTNYTEVGWYSGGAAPGEVGPAVILGHVDSKSGPAVFYSLGQVKIGDSVVITRSDGTLATFEITDLKRYPQSDFPTEEVYGPIDAPVLRLVTCSGTFDRGLERYSHNLVVYAKLRS